MFRKFVLLHKKGSFPWKTSFFVQCLTSLLFGIKFKTNKIPYKKQLTHLLHDRRKDGFLYFAFAYKINRASYSIKMYLVI